MADEFPEHPQGATRHAYGLTQLSLFTLDERHAVLSKNSALFTRHITRANTNATHAFFLIIPDVPFPAKEFKPRSYFFTSLWRKCRDVMLHVNRDPIHLKRTSFTTRYPNAFRYRAVMPTSSRWQKGLTSSSSGTEKDWLMCSTTARRTIVSARAR